MRSRLLARPSSPLVVASGLCAQAMAVGAHKITLGEFRMEEFIGRIAEAREFRPLVVSVIVIKDRDRVECDGKQTIHTMTSLKFAVDEPCATRLIVVFFEARSAVFRALSGVEGIGGLREACGAWHSCLVLWKKKGSRGVGVARENGYGIFFHKRQALRMRIARGLKQSYKNAREMTLEEVKRELRLATNCYEVLNEGLNRVYLDIDGSAPASATQEEFDALRNETLAVIDVVASGREIAVMESSKYETRKISFRVVFPNLKGTKKDSKAIATHLGKTVTLPEGVKFDLQPYGANQKMRMLGQSKDGENRPLVLVRGEVEDTFISSVPETAEAVDVPPEPKKPRGRPRKVIENTLIGDILAVLDVKRLEDYEMWIQIGFICFNEGVDVAVWEKASERSPKFKAGECEKKWRTFTKGHLGIATLWKWLQEDNPDAYDALKKNDYAFRKEQFELTHFKLRSPPRYVRVGEDNSIQFLTDAELTFLYRNEMCGDKPFTLHWINDPEILTYEKLTFVPNKEVPAGQYNIFAGFPMEPVEGDWSAIKELVWHLSGHNTDTEEYIHNWIADLFQNPTRKPGVALIFSSELEGVGKDTLGDYVVGPLLGQYYHNITDHENEFFGRFTSHLRNKLLIKLEEMNYEVFAKNDDKLKGWITCKEKVFEEKGVTHPPAIPSYVRIMGTTNEACPVKLTKTFRRYVLVNPSPDHADDTPYWQDFYENRLTQDQLQAYYHHLMSRDITGFNPRRRAETDALVEARQTQAPIHAKFFQRLIQTDPETEARQFYGRDLLQQVNAQAKFPLNEAKFGREINQYDGVRKEHTRRGNLYQFHMPTVEAYLRKKGWWIDI